MSTCVRGGSTYKRHKWSLRRNEQTKDCVHCGAKLVLTLGVQWHPSPSLVEQMADCIQPADSQAYEAKGQ